MNTLNNKLQLKKMFVLTIILFISVTMSPNNVHANTEFYEANTVTKNVTEKYFAAYFDLDFETLKELMHDDISFADPTADLIFHSEKVIGKDAVYENFKKGYASITEMTQTPIRTIYSSNTGIYEINIEFKFKEGANIISINMPLVIILTIKDGKVIEHRDYGDYNHFLRQYNDQRNK